ncbi:peptide-methionine (S)-S-oxide reductase MsrA [Hyphococcus lacteus]|uniref:Peptide methionine sulfoxide reductase MsrA n=1 Tax=Hyphococcus lacteus TaxID=3143536 RepID=A0ABV3Z833_9PROT
MKRLIIALIAGIIGTATITMAQPNDAPQNGSAQSATAVFAGGCFWCMEADFEKLDGVGDVVSGYAGGVMENPTYERHGRHLEVVQVPYDPSVISYRELADYFFRHIDPLDEKGQFCDRGHAYTTGLFYSTTEEYDAAKAAKIDAENVLNESVVTPLIELQKFWKAEGYHQNYYKTNPIRYKLYRTSCGRDRRVKQLWGSH